MGRGSSQNEGPTQEALGMLSDWWERNVDTEGTGSGKERVVKFRSDKTEMPVDQAIKYLAPEVLENCQERNHVFCFRDSR